MTSRSADTHANGTLLSIVALLLGVTALVFAVFPGLSISLLNLKGVGWGVVVGVLPTTIIAIASGWVAYRGLKLNPSKPQRVTDKGALYTRRTGPRHLGHLPRSRTPRSANRTMKDDATNDSRQVPHFRGELEAHYGSHWWPTQDP
jgi:hypothetical protein